VPDIQNRIGFGYDVHELVKGRSLVLGGVEIPYSHGLLGHSDADVLTHALCDALLGAAAFGDIGTHFPDSDSRYAGISSIILLQEVIGKLAGAGWALVNADLTIVAQAPRMAPYLPEMKARLSEACKVETARLNIKATTTEGLGFTGTGRGIVAYSVVLIGS